jgi:hypothetical protein
MSESVVALNPARKESALQIRPYWPALPPYWPAFFRVWTVKPDRIIEINGFFVRRTDILLLARVRDVVVEESIIQRRLGRETVKLITKDETAPVQVLPWVPAGTGEGIMDKLAPPKFEL